ncbi:MAG: alpha/beta fold hydrolase [Anaerolineae bacterium CFX3]|nr:alpha/beta fold hydrolase [Anaerolineae bacterium CFX3]MCQ3945320.1 alpha/beta hydrolase [Anaerolineae bacterium]RIK24734.1 MAG: 3-oxoadipate enol-lactonase [Anaerolineae bacterium]
MPKIQSNGINLYYEIHGEGQPLLFIHGLGSSSRDWELQTEEFSRSYRVIVFDLRGHGRSDKPRGPYSIPMFAADTVGLLEGLGVESPHVVGLSLGGMIAFQMGVDAPDAFKSLTIVNSGPEMVVRTFKERISVWQRLAVTRLLGMRKIGEVLSKRMFIKPEQEEIRRTFVERWAENDPRAYLDSTRAIIGWNVSDRVGSIKCPMLVVAADEDYTPVSVKEAYVARIPGARLAVIPDSRHATPVERPREFNQVLREFLESLS